ncbi:MAG: endo-1,4-beta-xylanase [Colwellia sp.]
MKAQAFEQEKFLGNIYSQNQIEKFTDYWNQVTPENAGKWGAVEQVRDVMNWTELDAAYALAKDNNLPFKMHVMIWGSQQPSWISSLTTAEKREEIEEWFAEVAARYDDIDYVEVVNEILHAPPNGEIIKYSTTVAANYADALGGDGDTGYDWVIKSFELARFYFPHSKLVINDYGIINSPTNTDTYLNIINLLKDRNLLDAIGFQAHAFSTGDSLTNMQANLDKLGNTGLDVYVTELDIDGIDDTIQLEEYQRIFPLFWEHSAVKGITLWGWRPGLWRDSEGAYLIDNDGNERPSLLWLRAYIANQDPTILPNQSFSISENKPALSSVGTIEVTDVLGKITGYSFSGDAGPFSIDNTGMISLASGQTLDFESISSYSLSITISGDFDFNEPVAITVDIIDVNEDISTPPPAEKSSSGGGAIFWLPLFLMGLILRQRQKAN